MEPIPVQQDIPLVSVPLENPHNDLPFDDEQVFEKLFDLRHTDKGEQINLQAFQAFFNFVY